jgi:iron complex transport system substrate-binding protein
MADEMSSIAEQVPDGQSPRVLMVYGREPVVAAGPGTFGHQLIERAGGTNVLADAGSNYPRIDIEKILELDPEVLLDASGMGRDAGTADFWSQFSTIRAVKQDRVFYLTETAVMRPGPRLPRGLEYIADAIYE